MTQMVENLSCRGSSWRGAAVVRAAQRGLIGDAAGRRAGGAGGADAARGGAERPLHLTTAAAEQALKSLSEPIKFTPAGGSVTLTAETVDGDVAIRVADTGVGIEPAEQARVFERFFKGDRGRGSGGTGLGLAIVKHVVQAHGGTVSVESRPGHGSTFTMRLPRR
jgi:hypothetical protein